MKRSAKQEIEIKLRVADAAGMRRLLRRMGARAVRRVHELNTLFDTPQGTLRKQGRLMRLREETALRGKGSGTGDQGSGKKRGKRGQGKARVGARYVLTFKGPVKKNKQQDLTSARPAVRDARDVSYKRYKVREEAEYIVENPRAIWAVAGPAGMRRSFRYEKFRTSYRVPGAGEVHVEFDETPTGVFLELEGPRRAIDRMARRLGYRPADYIVRSYAALHFEECRRRGKRAGDMMFKAKKSC